MRWLVLAVMATACASATPQPTSSNATATSATAAAATSSTGAPLPDLLLPSEATSSSDKSLPPNAKPPPKSEQPGCAIDQDCWSITCCPAVTADECVHHSLAQKCAIVDMTCPKLDTHLDCVCEAGACTGRAP